jgi:TusA-related sulfurtransferase
MNAEIPQQVDQYLDAKGLSCPLPLLKTKQVLAKMAVDQVLHVEATDAGSWRDIQVFVEHSVHVLVAANNENGLFSYWIRKGES